MVLYLQALLQPTLSLMFLIGINKVQTIVAMVCGSGIVVSPVLIGPVLGDLGPLRVQVAEVVSLEDEQRNGNSQRSKQDPHASNETGCCIRSEHI